MKLFKLTYNNGDHLFVAAEDFQRVTECYNQIKAIERIDDKVSVLKNRDGSVSYSETEWKQADSRFPPKEGENVVNYIQRLCRDIINVECSNRGYQSVFEQLKKVDAT